MGMEIVRMDDGEEFFLPEKEGRIKKDGDHKDSRDSPHLVSSVSVGT
jgi:hypothetical protein